MTPLGDGTPQESVSSDRSGPFSGQWDALTEITTMNPSSIPYGGCSTGNWQPVFPLGNPVPSDSLLGSVLQSWNKSDPQGLRENMSSFCVSWPPASSQIRTYGPPSLGAVLQRYSLAGPLLERLTVVCCPTGVLLGVMALNQDLDIGAPCRMCATVNQAK